MPNVSIPIAIQRKPEVLERLSNGELVRDIAESFGVSREQISRTLASDPEYQAAMRESLDARMEQREKEVECAEDGITLARADKLLTHARWRAERLNAAVYGQQRQAVAVHTDGPATINIVSYSDSTSTPATDNIIDAS